MVRGHSSEKFFTQKFIIRKFLRTKISRSTVLLWQLHPPSLLPLRLWVYLHKEWICCGLWCTCTFLHIIVLYNVIVTLHDAQRYGGSGEGEQEKEMYVDVKPVELVGTDQITKKQRYIYDKWSWVGKGSLAIDFQLIVSADSWYLWGGSVCAKA